MLILYRPLCTRNPHNGVADGLTVGPARFECDLLVHRRPETRLLASAMRNHQHRVARCRIPRG